MDTSRKISKEDILLLDEMEIDLRRKGEEKSQKVLIHEAIVNLARERGFLEMPTKKYDNTPQMVDRILRHEKSIKAGKNWMEEIDTSI